MKVKWLISISLIILAFSSRMQSQDVSAVARFDTTDILIGDQIDLNISFTMPLDYRVIWPFYQDTITRNVEIINMRPVDTLINESEQLVEMFQSITVTSFDSGYYYIPPVKFRYQPIDDTAFLEASSIPLYLEVHTMEVDTTRAIKAIKPPLHAPLTFREMLPWILIALAAGLIIFFIIYVIIRRKKNKPLFRIRPKVILPPYVVAMNGLEGLKEKKLWQAGKVKDYYTQMTDILRTYIEDRFGVQAIEMTTEEILDGMKGTDADKASIDRLAKTLVLADLVKFAREKPLPLDNDSCMNNSISFVRETKSDREIEEVMEKIRIENGEETSVEETIEGSSHADAREDDTVEQTEKEDKV
jgi:hypothetical protein